MKISYAIAFYLLVITGICMPSQKLTWFQAQQHCRDQNETLTLKQNESVKPYWTGFYKRLSHWINIIGCYSESTVDSNIKIEDDLSIMTPGFCQKTCLDKNIYLFAVQANRCVCLSSDFNFSSSPLSPSTCSYKCDNSALLADECGGQSAYNVYLTESYTGTGNQCLSLQCGSDHKFAVVGCSKYLFSLCNHTNLTLSSLPWRQSMDYCKASSSYLIGNINTTNSGLACTGLQNVGPGWVGVVKDEYVTTDQGQLIEERDQSLFISCEKCQLTRKNGTICNYEHCNKPLTQSVICSESIFLVTTLPDTTESSISTKPQTASTLDSTKQTEKHTESPVAAVVVPVVLVFILVVCAVVITLYIRKKKQSEKEQTNGAKKFTPTSPESYSDPASNINKNYFVLQQNNPSYELADDLQIHTKAESPYNETEDGTYDHLGDKDARKHPDVDDTYNHASVVMSPDLSDYDIANDKQVQEEDTTYDHTSPAENSYGHYNTSQTQETDYSELF